MTVKIMVLYYTQTGATRSLAENIALGVESVAGTEALLRTVPQVSSEAQPQKAVPTEGAVFATLEELQAVNGLAVGSPTRFGNMAAAMKYFWDGTGGLWQQGALIGKPVSLFTSSATMHGGNESTLLSMITPLLHHGMLVMGLPFSVPELTKTTTGGSPYGVTHWGGKGAVLSEEEKTLAFAQGKRLAEVAHKLAR